MQRFLLILASVVLLALILWLNPFEQSTSTDPSHAHVVPTSSGPQPSDRKRRMSLPAQPSGFGKFRTVDAGPLTREPTLTMNVVQQRGLMGQTREWVEKLMGEHRWKIIPSADGTTYQNANQVTLSFRYREGRVFGALAEFPETALSADLTALSEYFVGNGAHFPFHFESMTVPDPPERRGYFRDASGTDLYFRGRLRTVGDPPFGPARFEMATAPLDDGPFPRLEDDEHALKQKVEPQMAPEK